jgi:hypothetical protein
MPLTRLHDDAFDVQLEGVYFGLTDGSKTVKCLVNHEALTDKIRGAGPRYECRAAFLLHRRVIEEVASNKFDLDQVEKAGMVKIIISSRDLNPDQFA